MNNSFTSLQDGSNEKEEAYRLLKRLKIAFLFWLVFFVVTVIWFTNSPAF
jgi:hypothetical protein